MERMTVKKKVGETDRVLLYGTDHNYHLIARTVDDVEVGDTVEYEPYGVNFGWFKRVIYRPSSKAV
ncbi:MAG: hypothetical protein HYW89_01735 [Candidatus Sungiibacteriota bacterium]|uniref:Uncharacterized protein n=1 Tax=Candidatus Sungiibacteriota bacterium TaxID=2750080 RepID=A0A7T5URJ3_9BACT|nr:MAG: hypothetical protein HYW89_01735 [Candidatus Sungbacteria bacterium]